MFNQNDYKTDSNINLKMNIDPNLKDDTMLKMGDNDIPYAQLRDMYNINNQQPIRCLIYWEDVMQFTSIGLIEIINSLYDFNAKIDFLHFFRRPNEYSNGLSYVFKLFENKLDRETIVNIRDKYFWKILEISVKSSIFASVIKTSTFFNTIGFWFPCRFANDENLKVGLKNMLLHDKSFENFRFHYGTEESFNDALKRGYNSVITPNILSTYNYIIKNNMKRISIIGPEEHNGLTDEMYNVFEKYNKLPKPNFCGISLYKEQIYG